MERQQRPGQRRRRHARGQCVRNADQRQQKAQGRVASQIQVDVKPGPVRRRHARREEHQGDTPCSRQPSRNRLAKTINAA